MKESPRSLKAAQVYIRLHIDGQFLFRQCKTEYVGGLVCSITGESTSSVTYNRLRRCVDDLVGPNKISLIWYRKMGKNLTCGRTILKSDVDVEDALRSRDKNNTIDLYVTSKVREFMRDPVRGSPLKCPTTKMESSTPLPDTSIQIPPIFSSSQPTLIDAVPLRSSPTKDTLIASKKSLTISAPTTLLYPLNTKPLVIQPTHSPPKKSPKKSRKLTPRRRVNPNNLSEYGFDTDSGVVTRSVSGGVRSVRAREDDKEVHVLELGQGSVWTTVAVGEKHQVEDGSEQLIEGPKGSEIIETCEDSNCGRESTNQKDVPLKKQADVPLKKVTATVRGRRERNGADVQTRDEAAVQAREEADVHVRNEGEVKLKEAVESGKQARLKSQKSEVANSKATTTKVVTRSVAEKQQREKKKRKQKVAESRKGKVVERRNKGKQLGRDNGKGKVGVKRKKLSKDEDSFSDSDFAISEDSEYSDLDIPFTFGEQDLDKEELCEKEHNQSVSANLTAQRRRRRRRTTQVNFDDSGEDSGDLVSLDGSDEEGVSFPVFNPDVDFKKNIDLKEGLKFPNIKIFRKALVHHAIENKYDFYYLHNGRERVTIYCKLRCDCKWNKERAKIQCECDSVEKCTFKVHGKKLKQEKTFQLKSMNLKHTCIFKGYNKKVSSEYLAESYLEDWRDNPSWELSVFQKRVFRDLGVNVSYAVCWLARARAKLIIYGDGEEEYGRVWDYAAAIIKYNPGSTAIVKVDNVERPPTLFQRMFICLKPIKNGFLAGCRPIVGVDGCHLKGAYPGMCLVAVGKDGNNNIFPLAWAVVEVENGETWSWLLHLLVEDLGKEEGKGLTFMSDRQKGLLDAFTNVAPKADIRFCVRHIWANFKLQFAGQAFKDGFWRAARSTSKAEFDGQMEGIKFLSPAAHSYLASIPPKHWSRHAFSTTCKSNMLLNNMCETFNSVLKPARDKPILTLMEWIRRYVMKRICEKREGLSSVEGSLLPYVREHFSWAESESNFCNVVPSNIDEYEVDSKGETYVVNLKERKCSCFHWELTGLPCPHAMTCILQQRGNKEDYVDEVYSKATYAKAYEHSISAMPGMKQWERVEQAQPLPPPFRKLPGRPSHKKRRKEHGEGTSKQLKRPRKPRACGKCGQLGLL